MIKLKHVAFSILSGVLLSLPWITNFSYTIFIAFVPLLLINDYFFTKKKDGLFPFWLHSFLTFFCWNAIVSAFILKFSLISAIGLWITTSTLMSIVWWLFFKIELKNNFRIAVLFLISGWIAYEHLQFIWDFEWTWLTLGNAFSNHVRIVQWYEFTGVFGGTLWILIVNLLVFKSIKKKVTTKKRILFGGLSMVTILIPLLISLQLYAQKETATKEVSALIIQPNINPYTEKFNGLTEQEQFNRFYDLAKQFQDSTVDLVIGPETFFHNLVEHTIIDQPGFSKSDSMFALFPESSFLIGAITYDIDSTKFNSALLFTKNTVQIYHKQKLVSGVEKVPFSKYFRFFSLPNLSDLSTIEAQSTFEYLQGRLAVPICYEAIFGKYCSQLANEDIQLFVNITNDGWWEHTSGYRQHFKLARLRCIENRKPMIRAANTGISAFINEKGEVLKATTFGKQEALKGVLNTNTRQTFYMRFNDYIANGFTFLFLLLFLKFIVESLK